MSLGCPRCGGPAAVGVLCRRCAAALPTPEALIPDHLVSRIERQAAAGWLIDGFGFAHALGGARTLIGRRPQADLVVLDASVSRDHAELHRGGEGWQLRDLGSRNASYLDGQRVHGRAALGDGAIVRFGEVPLLFIGRPVPLPAVDPGSVVTGHAAGSTFRYTLRGSGIDLCLIGSAAGGDGGGALLHRPPGAPAWAETSLPPLEFQLLRLLSARAVVEAGSPSRSRGCVPTRQLASDLPFQSRYANEENVRQVVRRLRATLDKLGADGLIEALPGRGYFVTWPVLDQ
jgi:hypothetical protein